MKYTIALVGLSALLSGCSKPAPAAAKPEPAAAAKPAAPAEAKAVPDQLPDVLAKVNGETVSKVDFEQALQALEQRAGRSVPAEQRNQVYREVLDQLIGLRLIQQEAKSRKIDIADKDLNDRIDAFKQHFGSPEEFTKALTEQKLTLDQFKEQTRGEMRMAKVMETEVEAKVKVQPSDLDDFYKKNPEQFRQPERVRASHILFTVAADADAKAKEQAKAKAAGVLKQLRAGGDFAALAKKHSQDPGNAPNGGDLGFFGRGQMVGAFERAAFGLKPGEVSDLVETPFGFHIIKVAEKQPEKMLAIDEVRPQLEEFLKQRQRQEMTVAFVNTLKTKSKVEVLI